MQHVCHRSDEEMEEADSPMPSRNRRRPAAGHPRGQPQPQPHSPPAVQQAGNHRQQAAEHTPGEVIVLEDDPTPTPGSRHPSAGVTACRCSARMPAWEHAPLCTDTGLRADQVVRFSRSSQCLHHMLSPSMIQAAACSCNSLKILGTIGKCACCSRSFT